MLDIFPNLWYQFILSPTISESSGYSVPSEIFRVVSFQKLNHSSQCVVSDCGYKFESMWWLMLNFFACVYWPSVYLCLWSVQMCSPFKIGLSFCYWFVEGSLYDLLLSHLSDIHITNISPSLRFAFSFS